jgi:hypothetical protein
VSRVVRFGGFLCPGGKRGLDFLPNVSWKNFDHRDDVGCLDNPPSRKTIHRALPPYKKTSIIPCCHKCTKYEL